MSQERLRAAIDDALTRRPRALAVVTAGGVFTYQELARRMPEFQDRTVSVRVSDRSIGDVAFVVSALLADRPFQFVSPERWGAGGARAAAERAVSERTGSTPVAYLTRSSGTRSDGTALHLVSRRSLGLYLDGLLDRIGAAPESSFAVSTPLWYDLSYTSLFGALAVGGCVHLLSAAACSSGRQFAAYFRTRPVDYLKITPTLFSALYEGSVRPTVAVIFGGELLPWWLVERVRGAGGDAPRLFNHYGPAETTIGACAGEVPPSREGTESVPIGAPLRHVAAAIDVDAPIGGDRTVGELILSGPQVTANLDLNEAGQLAYRTRDRVRALPGGGYEFLGRLDRRVKVRGELVDLSEVERLVRGLAGVGQVTAGPIGDAPAEQLLLSVTPAAGVRLDRRDIYRHLERYGPAAWGQSLVRIQAHEPHESGKRR